MSKELVIASNRHENKVAILEDDQLVEVFFQRANEYSLAGSIHKGRVTRVLPGMQSAFVDLGLERDTFLYVSDFFEENEDIDRVVEDKPPTRRDRPERGDGGRPERGERATDRGGRTDSRGDQSERNAPERNARRGPQRLNEEGQTEPREIRSAAPVSEFKVQAPEGEAGVPAEGLSTAAPGAEASESRPPERTENDRGFRGDRPNRRGRRRRQRGRGFPENKYAQPVSSPAAVAGSSAPSETTASGTPDDVIILPGESLAKYRRMSVGADSVSRPDDEIGSAEESIQPSEPDDTAPESISSEEQEAIEAEAEELELAEKVFAHHDDESVGEVEEKIDEVKQDQPIPPPPVSDETREESEPNLTANAEVISFHPTSATRSAEAEGIPAFDESLSDVDPEGESLEADEFESFETESPLEGAEEELDRGEQAEQVEASPATTPGQAQTASVREQGGRYMHRAPRRMRRRRGGNRFAQGTDFSAPGSGTAAAPGTALAGAAAAAALEPEARRDTYEERSAEKPDRAMPSISDLLKAGQEIIVQIAKEPLGQKGARITSHVALPGRYVVFMPSVTHMGVSRKIASDEERQRLKRILLAHRAGTTGGFIVRTAGEGVPEDEIAADMNFLYSLWLDIREKAEKKPAPVLLHYDLDIVQRILRDQVTEDFKAIWVDNEEMYENVLTFMQRFQPAFVSRVKMYTRSAPIFDAFNITQELEKALRPKVWLKSGGYIVINQTEALVAIDINTGKYVGKSNRLEDTIVKTNTEAVKEIVRQIRLRDLGGIIVVDFIDMDERKNRQKVMQALEEAMDADRAPYKILQFNDFGLVAITRKRVKQSLERTLCSPCPYCEGAGYVKSVQTIVSEILVEAQKIAKAIEGKDVMLRAHPDVTKVLKASNNQYLEEIEEILGRPVLVTGDPTLHHEKFDLA